MAKLVSNSQSRLISICAMGAPAVKGAPPRVTRVRLSPGLNQVDEKDWEAVKKDKFTQALLDKGWITDSETAIKEASEVTSQAQSELEEAIKSKAAAEGELEQKTAELAKAQEELEQLKASVGDAQEKDAQIQSLEAQLKDAEEALAKTDGNKKKK